MTDPELLIKENLRLRLRERQVIYIADPTRQNIARKMAQAGEVVCTDGEGGDAGLLLVRKAVRWGGPGSGGSAA